MAISRAGQLRKEIAAIRKEMRAQGVRRISCFNGGLTPQEYLYNSRLFVLETSLQDAKKTEESHA